MRTRIGAVTAAGMAVVLVAFPLTAIHAQESGANEKTLPPPFSPASVERPPTPTPAPMLAPPPPFKAATEASPPRPAPSLPVPLGSPGNWVQSYDYPESERINSVEGVVDFEVVVDERGRVESCEIVESSGSVALDEAACAKVTQRARFQPARDRNANPIAGAYSNSVRWVIPRNEFPKPMKFSYSFVVDADGKVISCEVLAREGAIPGNPDLSECPRMTHFNPPTDAEGNPVRRRFTFSVGIAEEDLPAD